MARTRVTMILDVREAGEFKKDGSKGVNIPHHTVKYRLDLLPREEEITVICVNGQVSRKIAYYLSTSGYSAVSGGSYKSYK